MRPPDVNLSLIRCRYLLRSASSPRLQAGHIILSNVLGHVVIP